MSNNECKPVLEVIDEFEAGDISETDVLWYIPLKGKNYDMRGIL